MHPAPSVIIFTALSGLGFGLLAWLGMGYPAVTGMTAFIFFFIAYALAVGGLISSTFHLGNPQRAIKAFSQWRSSWLSREAVLSVIALCVMGIYASGSIFLEQKWQIIGQIGAALSMITVFTTSMIYAQMKTVPRWNMPITPVLFLLYALTGGALLAGQVQSASVLLIVLGIIQYTGWVQGDKSFAQAGHTIESATGLGDLGKVRMLESPHSSPNYLMKEMVHIVGRKHAQKLRIISILLLGIIPPVILLALPHNHMLAGVAVISHIVGLFVSRWLFFAEAEHVVGLYYGKR
jgi:DMSO reductase anchor subunit